MMNRVTKKFVSTLLALLMMFGALAPLRAAAAEAVQVVVAFGTYQGIGGFQNGTALAYKDAADGKTVGLLSTDGSFKELGTYQFDKWVIATGGQGYQTVYNGDDIFYITKSGQTYDWINNPDAEGLMPVQKGNKWGMVDASGNEVIAPKFYSLDTFKEDRAVVAKQYSWDNVKYGFINRSGNEMVDYIYNYVGGFSNGFAYYVKGDQAGYLDPSGKEVLGTYDEARSFSEGFAAVRKGDKWGYIDTTGKLVVDYIYYSANDFKEGMAAVGIGTSWEDAKYGYIDTTGKQVVPCTYRQVNDFSEGRGACSIGTSWEDAKWGYVDRTGKLVIDCIYCNANDFKEGLAAVSVGTSWENAKYGYINLSGETVGSFSYSEVTSIENGFGMVGIADAFYNYKWGFVNAQGTPITAVEFDGYPFNNTIANGYATFQKGDSIGLIDNTGTIRLQPVYSGISIGEDNLFTVSQNGKFGVVRLNREFMLGDADGDYSITALDMMAIKRHILKKQLLTGDRLLAADADQDGSITALDMMAIKRHILKKQLLTSADAD